MKILLVGKGGREHALAYKISRSPLLSKLYIWPGNPAMADCGEALDLDAAASFEELGKIALNLNVDGVISGPEAPLAEGLADYLQTIGIPTFGPIQSGAELEASKEFAKDVMACAGIPTARYVTVSNEDDCRAAALKMLEEKSGVVLKASGLAGGKGVFVCFSSKEIENGLDHLFHSNMSVASQVIVVEEVLRGRECSYFTFVGNGVSTGLSFAVDFKRLNDGDEGPNTGGMGCYAPVPWLPADAREDVEAQVVVPLLQELKKRDIDYCGCIYVGLMWADDGFAVVEFNVRLGDPEAQVLAAYDDRDWLALMANAMGLKVSEEALAMATKPPSHDRKSVVVTMASQGYPYGGAEKDAVALDGSLFSVKAPKAFAASIAGNSENLSTGKGRVLSVIGSGSTFAEARLEAYRTVDEVGARWDGAQWRKDIAKRVSEENI